ncbi:MAG: putative toxin-antitoxin system toxin component, PIN family [Dehalococcoidia bacterium]
MRAVLDTVIFVRALINPKGRWGRLLFDLSDRYVIVLSPDIIREIVAVLYRPGLLERFPQMADPPQLDRVLRLFEQAEIVEPEVEVSICRDPNDDKFFACAAAGRADYIVTEDNDILAVEEHRGARPITAAEFRIAT